MGQKSKFEKDFIEVVLHFPKLKYKEDNESKYWIVFGDLDICDQAGDYWDTFKIKIYVSQSYPYCIPLVKEESKVIERDDNWHIDKNGFCCVDIEHKLLINKRRGINLADFIKNKVYSYFANQLYKMSKGSYAAGEYDHYFEGIKQYYIEELNITNTSLAITILNKLLENKLPNRNDPCLCGNGKYKNCHYQSIELLKSISKEQLKADLKEFKKLDIV